MLPAIDSSMLETVTGGLTPNEKHVYDLVKLGQKASVCKDDEKIGNVFSMKGQSRLAAAFRHDARKCLDKL